MEFKTPERQSHEEIRGKICLRIFVSALFVLIGSVLWAMEGGRRPSNLSRGLPRPFLALVALAQFLRLVLRVEVTAGGVSSDGFHERPCPGLSRPGSATWGGSPGYHRHSTAPSPTRSGV